VAETGNRLSADIEYNTDLYDRDTIARLAEHFRVVLAAAARAPERRFSELPLLSPDEQRQIVHDWNATRADLPDACVPQLFERQVAETPDAVALIYQDRSMTYAELNRKANQLAHTLRGRGVGPDSVVGICVERSLDMVLG